MDAMERGYVRGFDAVAKIRGRTDGELASVGMSFRYFAYGANHSFTAARSVVGWFHAVEISRRAPSMDRVVLGGTNANVIRTGYIVREEAQYAALFEPLLIKDDLLVGEHEIPFGD
jgi:hypothetical protein